MVGFVEAVAVFEYALVVAVEELRPAEQERVRKRHVAGVQMAVTPERHVEFAVGVVANHARVGRLVDEIVDGGIRIPFDSFFVEHVANGVIQGFVLVLHVLAGVPALQCIEIGPIGGIHLLQGGQLAFDSLVIVADALVEIHQGDIDVVDEGLSRLQVEEKSPAPQKRFDITPLKSGDIFQ